MAVECSSLKVDKEVCWCEGVKCILDTLRILWYEGGGGGGEEEEEKEKGKEEEETRLNSNCYASKFALTVNDY